MTPEFNKTEGPAEQTQRIMPAEAAEPQHAVDPEAKGTIFGSLQRELVVGGRRRPAFECPLPGWRPQLPGGAEERN